jgi:hypothetical protein
MGSSVKEGKGSRRKSIKSSSASTWAAVVGMLEFRYSHLYATFL